MEDNTPNSAIYRGRERLKNTTTTTDDETITPALPEQLIMDEILARLPVKSLLRFKSVSKFWLFTISHNPHFAKLHLNFSAALRPQFFVIAKHLLGRSGTCFLLPYKECSDAADLVGLEDRFVLDQIHWSRIVNSCNGLVCLYNRFLDLPLERGCFFAVWNPATRQSRDIHSPPGLNLALAYGFGYVSSIDDYKIVASFTTECEDKRGFYVFSIRDGNWRRIVGTSLQFKNAYNRGVLVGDTLYWPNQGRPTNCFVGFNLVREDWKEHNITNLESVYGHVQLYRLKGCLALALHGSEFLGNSDIWILKDLDDWSSWQKLFTVQIKIPHLITSSETGKCLVHHSEQFKLVDHSKEALEAIEGNGFYGCAKKAIEHVESLVSPFKTSGVR